MELMFPISPIAASRPRVSGHGTYYKGPYKQFRIDAPPIVDEVLGDHEPLDGHLHVEVDLRVVRPKTTKLAYPKADIDNYLKAVFDILNGKLWIDDKQIVSIAATKAWAPPGEPGYFNVRVYDG